MDQSANQIDSGQFDLDEEDAGSGFGLDLRGLQRSVFLGSDDDDDQYDSEDSLTERCEKVFAEKLDSHAKLRNKWSRVENPKEDGGDDDDVPVGKDQSESSPNASSSSSFADSMETLKTGIISLMNEDDELFKRLLRLNQVIKRMKRFRLHNPDFPLIYEDPFEQPESPYCISDDLENATSSATSTWSTSASSQHPSEPFRSSSSSKYESAKDCDDSWNRKFVRELCRKRHGRRKRDSKSDQVSSYDSGIHEPSSDSDHEIFV